jgi:hypothetical protein
MQFDLDFQIANLPCKSVQVRPFPQCAMEGVVVGSISSDHLVCKTMHITWRQTWKTYMQGNKHRNWANPVCNISLQQTIFDVGLQGWLTFHLMPTNEIGKSNTFFCIEFIDG